MYLGVAPGAGKTYSMLAEGQRRRSRGQDVMVGVVDVHGRVNTERMVVGLEVVPPRVLTVDGTVVPEMDLPRVLLRKPAVVLIDELAHRNVAGCEHEQRWQDVEELLEAGVDVITNLNIEHLESLTDVIERVTGSRPTETIPDDVVRRAEQVEVVDISPEALRRRLTHGNIYPAERIDAALARYFRPGNLAALRELALIWVAEHVDHGLQEYRTAHGIREPWETRERIVTALPGGPEGEVLVRRAARIAARTVGADLLALHVVRGDRSDVAALAHQRQLVESVGGSWHQVQGDDVARTVLDFARAQNATQVVVGSGRRSRLGTLLGGEGVGARMLRLSQGLDVHVVTDEILEHGSRGFPDAGSPSALSRPRQVEGAALAVIALPALTWVLSALRTQVNLSSDILLYLTVVIAVAVTGGLWPALGAAVAASLLLNYYFTPPMHTFTIAEANNALALVVFLMVAGLVAWLVERVGRRTTQAAQAAAEAATLSSLAGGVLRGETSTASILERARETFNFTSITLLERAEASREWDAVVRVGQPAGSEAPAFTLPVGSRRRVTATGAVLGSGHHRLFAAFTAQALVAREQELLAKQAARVEEIAEVDRTRTALLAAVSHDLRSPLASATAAVMSLSSADVHWTDSERAELVATAQESLQQLSDLIENLLDMSRLQAGALAVNLEPVAVDEVVVRVLDGVHLPGKSIRTAVPEAIPDVRADAVLLERVLANLVANAARYSPDSRPPVIAASTHGSAVEIRVVDTGPGVRPQDKEQVFQPFQRLGDRDNTTGLGLGLALSRGLTEAMGGTLSADDTPGGGLTMTVSLPCAATTPTNLHAAGRTPGTEPAR